ncbi:MAG: hypothetical protein M1457_05185 [bacterium]|nr:hypothetical protein [bacterium]
MFWQLLKKEYHLQRSSLMFALAVLLIWGVLMGLAPRAENYLIPNQLTMGQLVSLMQAFFVGPCLLGLAPLFVGAALVAEERKLRVWDWHLSLPGSRRRQWALKLAVGAAITLVLALFVQPALDRALTHALGGRGDPFPLPIHYLHLNGAYVWLPLLLMVAGAFVSSMASDPYKAFFGGLVAFGAALACTRLVDPAGLLLMPYASAMTVRNGVPFMIRPFDPLLPIGLAAALGGLAWFNFRCEGFRWRRFLAEVAGLIVLSCAVSWAVLRFEFDPMPLLTQQTREVEPRILNNRRDLGEEKPSVNWTAIRPLLVKRSVLDLAMRLHPRWASEFYGPRMFGHLYRIPGTSRLLAEVYSFPGYFGTNEPTGWAQVIEIDVTTRHLRPIYQVWGRVGGVYPESRSFVIDSFRHNYLVTDWLLPIRVGGLFWNIWASGKGLRSYGWGSYPFASSDKKIVVDGQSISYESLNPVDDAVGYSQLFIKRAPAYETWLIRRQPDHSWTRIDQQRGYMHYIVSTDGKWYARASRTDTGYGSKPITILSADHATSWTLANPNGSLFLGNNNVEYLWDVPVADLLGANSIRAMPVSPDGRFLAFLRTTTIKVDVDDKPTDTGYPESLQFCALDLQSGREYVLMDIPLDIPLDRQVREQFKRQMQNWLWSRWNNEEGPRWAGGGRRNQFPPPMNSPDFPRYHQSFPPMVWAPTGNRLAILYGGQALIYRYYPEYTIRFPPQTNRPSEVKKDLFVVENGADLTGFEASDLAFWDDQTLLAWGDLGLFRISLDKTK